MLIGLAAALASALCFGSASFIQAVTVGRSAAPARVDHRLLSALVRQPLYLLSVGLDVAGFAGNVVALRSLPLFIVQPTVAASIGVTAALAGRWLGLRLSARDVVSLLGLGLALTLLAAGGQVGSARPLSEAGSLELLAALPLLAVLGSSMGRMSAPWGPSALAVVSGLGFGGAGLAARALGPLHGWVGLVLAPGTWAIGGFWLLGMAFFAHAAARGSIVQTSAMVLAVETVTSSLAGIAWLGDASRPGPGVALSVTGFALTLVSALALTRFSDPAAAYVAAS